MSIYRQRFSRFPRTLTIADSRLGLTRQLGAIPAQRPVLRDAIIGSSPVPDLSSTWGTGHRQQQPPGPFIGEDLPPHLVPPRNWEHLDKFGYVLLPAIGSTATILSFTVPIGRDGIINAVANNWVGGGWIAGSADVVWRFLIDNGPIPGATDYHSIVDSLGPQADPTPISGFRIFENQTFTAVVLNNPAGDNGGVIVSGQKAGARVLGYLFPRDLQYVDLWV